MAHNDTPMDPVKGQAGPALVAVAVLTAGLLLFVIIAAFSQNNTRTSIDGDRSVYSGQLEGDLGGNGTGATE